MFGLPMNYVVAAACAVLGFSLVFGDKAWAWLKTLKIPAIGGGGSSDKQPTRDEAYGGVNAVLAYMVHVKNPAGIELAKKLGAELFSVIPTEGA